MVCYSHRGAGAKKGCVANIPRLSTLHLFLMPGGVSGSTKIKAKRAVLTEVAWRYGSCSLYRSIGLDHIGLGDKACEEQTLTGGSVCTLLVGISSRCDRINWHIFFNVTLKMLRVQFVIQRRPDTSEGFLILTCDAATTITEAKTLKSRVNTPASRSETPLLAPGSPLSVPSARRAGKSHHMTSFNLQSLYIIISPSPIVQ